MTTAQVVEILGGVALVASIVLAPLWLQIGILGVALAGVAQMLERDKT